jgi:hypothetical protein
MPTRPSHRDLPKVQAPAQQLPNRAPAGTMAGSFAQSSSVEFTGLVFSSEPQVRNRSKVAIALEGLRELCEAGCRCYRENNNRRCR